MPKNIKNTKNIISLFISSLYGGGAERIMVHIANKLATQGYKVDLILSKSEGPYLTNVEKSVRIIDLNSNNVLIIILKLFCYLRREKPNVMLSALTHVNIIAIIARYFARIPMRLVVSERNSPSHMLSGEDYKNTAINILIRYLYPSANAIVCISDGVLKEMHNLYNIPLSKLYRIYNPLDVDYIKAMAVESIHHTWLSKHDIPVILAVGRLVKQKDYPNLLRAFAYVHAKRPVRLIILGQGKDENNLKILAHELGIDEYVAFMGFQKNPFAWMRACDLYVLSSRWEGLSNSLLEALACNMKVVSTDCPVGPYEVLEGGKWGYLVPVNDSVALAEAIELALENTPPYHSEIRADAFRSEYAIKQYLDIMKVY